MSKAPKQACVYDLPKTGWLVGHGAPTRAEGPEHPRATPRHAIKAQQPAPPSTPEQTAVVENTNSTN